MGSAATAAATAATAAATAVVAEAFSVAVSGLDTSNTAAEGVEDAPPYSVAIAGVPLTASEAESVGETAVEAAAESLAAGDAPASISVSYSEAGAVVTARRDENGGGGTSSSEADTVVRMRHDENGGGCTSESAGFGSSYEVVSTCATDLPGGPAPGTVYKKRVFGRGAAYSGARDARKEELDEEEVGGSTSPPSVESSSQSALPVIGVTTSGIVHGAGADRSSRGQGGVDERTTRSVGREGATGNSGDGFSSNGNSSRKASRLAFSELKHDVREERLYKANTGVLLSTCSFRRVWFAFSLFFVRVWTLFVPQFSPPLLLPKRWMEL